MGAATITDVYARMLTTYLVQLIMGLVVCGIFYYFSRAYNRSFLRTWAWSWMAFCLYMFGSFLVLHKIEHGVTNRTLANWLTQAGALLQILFLLVGTYELTKAKIISLKTHSIVILLTLLVATVTVLAYTSDPSDFNLRYMLRFGFRMALAGIGFLIASLVVWFNPTFTKGFGQKMLAGSFLFFSIEQFYYFSIVVVNIVGGKAEIPSFFGLIDILLIALMAMSMVMWLLEDERERLRVTNSELDSFLYSTSHDLRAPLASILGLANVSKYDVTDANALKLFGMIEERAKKLDLVIDDILNLARSKKKELKIEKLEFSDLLYEILNDIRFVKGTTSIEFIYKESAEHWLYSDTTQLKIILANLLSNAVKYHNLLQPKPFIKVDFIKDEKRILISIEDNGQGIPFASQPKIFEMFYRASLHTQGTGLGLYITREAVHKLQGEISFISTEGNGTRFLVSLPHSKKIK
jgi:signal transduction histidine kinase